jgi:hypothetical protein
VHGNLESGCFVVGNAAGSGKVSIASREFVNEKRERGGSES